MPLASGLRCDAAASTPTTAGADALSRAVGFAGGADVDVTILTI